MSQESERAADHATTQAGAQTGNLSLAEKRALAERLLQKRAGAASTVFAQSYSQRAMWFLHQMDPESAAYHVAFAARICSALDTAALARAAQRMVDRHPALRTTFANGDPAGGGLGPVQSVAGYRQAALVEIEAGGWDEDELRLQVLAAYVQPFDLEKGPALRLTLFRLPSHTGGAAEHVLLMVAHHIVMDGWSVGLYLNELLAAYAAEAGGQALALPAPAGRYADYVAWAAAVVGGAGRRTAVGSLAKGIGRGTAGVGPARRPCAPAGAEP
jgi:hypothetical protein